MKYFEQTQITGSSVWWSWIFGTWIALVIWTIGQTFLVGVMIGVASAMQPDIANAFAVASETMISSEDFENYSSLSSLALLLTLVSILGMIFTLLWVNDGNKDDFKARNIRILSSLTAFSILLAAGLFFYSNSMLDGTAYMAVMQQAMGLSPFTYGLFLLTFPIGCVGLYLAQKIVHRRTIISLHTAIKSIRWGWIGEGFIISWIVIGALMLIGSTLGLLDIRMIFSNSAFWGFALTSLLLIPLQAGTEEIVFRGYFNQALIHFLKNKWVVFVITSLGFMALHLSNPEALEGAASGTLPIVMSGYFFFGFAMCLLVWLDDGLETAIGVHAGNNCFAAILVNYEGSVLPTPSVFLATPEPVKDAIMTVMYLSIIVAIIWWRRGGPARSDDTPSIAAA